MEEFFVQIPSAKTVPSETHTSYFTSNSLTAYYHIESRFAAREEREEEDGDSSGDEAGEDNADIARRTNEFQVDRRFSQFEALHAYIKGHYKAEVIPELPKKRIFNQGEQIIELRRQELEKFLRALLRNQTLREAPAVRFFLT